MGHITCHARWREELVATSDQGVLVFELMMGKLHLYFPDRERWKTQVPSWALDQWEDYHRACQLWCGQNRIPMSVVDDAHVSSE